MSMTVSGETMQWRGGSVSTTLNSASCVPTCSWITSPSVTGRCGASAPSAPLKYGSTSCSLSSSLVRPAIVSEKGSTLMLVPCFTESHWYSLSASPSDSRRLVRVTAESCTAPLPTFSLTCSAQSVSRSRLPFSRTVSPAIRPSSSAFFGCNVTTLLSAEVASSAVSRFGSTNTLAAGLSSSPIR